MRKWRGDLLALLCPLIGRLLHQDMVFALTTAVYVCSVNISAPR